MDVKESILMEAGTNELEVLIFELGDERFGINVAKIREIIRVPALTKPPKTNPIIIGVINLRDQIIPVISLRTALSYPEREPSDKDRVIVSEYHNNWFGFVVDSVDNIVRISWNDIEPPPDVHKNASSLTGVAHLGEDLILMLDVETLTEPLILHTGNELYNGEGISESVIEKRASMRILAADDSGVIRSMVQNHLEDAGYTNLQIVKNGEEAWEAIQEDPTLDLVITDIEMPKIDGLHLTKLIKSNHKFKHLPVIIFSSIISKDNFNKGKQVGADDQISKPEIGRLVQTIDGLLGIS